MMGNVYEEFHAPWVLHAINLFIDFERVAVAAWKG